MSNDSSLPNENKIKQGNAPVATQHANNGTPSVITDPQEIAAYSTRQQAARISIWDNIPAELQALNQWVVCGLDKVPHTVTDGHPHKASPTQGPWMSFSNACAYAANNDMYIGIVLTADDPFVCVDMDVKDSTNVNKKTGLPLIEPEWSTEDDLAEYCNFISANQSYTEFSLSSKSAHIWFKGTVGRGRRNARWEIYDRERFIICTGNTFISTYWEIESGVASIKGITEGCNPIKARQNMVDGVLHEIGQASGSGELAELEEVDPTKTDEDIMQIAVNAANGDKFYRLYSGDTTMHNGDTSSADQALIGMLCFYTESNEQVRRLFLASKLGERDKVIKRGAEYIDRSIARARSDINQEKRKTDQRDKLWLHKMKPTLDALMDAAAEQMNAATGTGDYNQLSTTTPLPTVGMVNTDKPTEVDIEYLDNPLIPKGRAIGIYGRGESGKSSMVSTLCANNSHNYSTLWITSEEPEAHIKIRHLCSRGKDNTIGVVDGSGFNIYQHLADAIKEAKSKMTTPLGFVVLDAVVTLVVWGSKENANDDAGVKRLIRFIDYIAQAEGVSILMIGHLKKGSDHGHIADAVLGAAAWTSSVRLAYMLRKLPDEDYAGFMRTAKTSLGSAMGAFYKTVPVHKMTANIDGYSPSLCKVEFTSERIYGERALTLAMGEDNEQTARMRERDQRITTTVECIMKMLEGGAQITRADIHKQLGNPVSKRDWTNVEPALIAKQVNITNGVANRKHYQLMRLVR